MDTAARAAARFENDLYAQLAQQRAAEGHEDPGDLPKIFDKEQFTRTFRRLLLIRIELQLIDLLELHEYRDDLIQHGLAKELGVPQTKNIVVKPPEGAYYGDDREFYLHQVRKSRK